MPQTSSASAASAKKGGGALRNTLIYMRQHWQLYVLFMMPAFVLTIVFRYIPMGGVLIAFEEYNPFRGVFGSEWVGLAHFRRFLSSPDFMRYLTNTLKLSIYGLLWGFPAPILLAFLLNRVLSTSLKQKIKDFYSGNKETAVEETAAVAPSDTGSSAAGIAVFAAMSVAAAAAFVCTRKKSA